MTVYALSSSRILRGLIWAMFVMIAVSTAQGQYAGETTAAGRIVTVCNSGTVIRSNDGGRTWERLGPVEARNTIAYVGRSGVSAGAVSAHGESHPHAWVSPSVTSGPLVISVFTALSGSVDVAVCNTAGAVVAQWTDAECGSGLRKILFDAARLSAGRYFYRIVSGGSVVWVDSFVVAR